MATRKKKKNSEYDKVIGIDLGNGLIKVRSVTDDGEAYKLNLPSGFSYLKDVGDTLNNSTLDLDVYEIDGVEYVWGEDITKVSNFKSTYGHENRYKTEAYKIMAQIVMARVVRDLEIGPYDRIMIVTGVPSNETDSERVDDIALAFYGANDDNVGFHKVVVNEEDCVFKVVHVEVTGQALATVLGRYLSEDGYVENEEYENMKVAVIDIGAGTSDIDIVKSLRRLNGYDSVPKGFRDVYESIRSCIQSYYPSHKVTDYELLDILKDTSSSDARYIYKPSKRKKEVDFTKALYDGVNEVAMDIQQTIMSKWKDHTDLDEVLLVGGSAEFFSEHLEEIIDGITIPDNNGDSDVEGYFRVGMYIANVLKGGDE
ncbi:plasmid segregation protein ParM [Bacillus subtilis]|nr:plasmid segregation protein ParM [Bacillus subtilis]MED3474728.1 plasmid segregation protein ParM [Bacillus subtilis]